MSAEDMKVGPDSDFATSRGENKLRYILRPGILTSRGVSGICAYDTERGIFVSLDEREHGILCSVSGWRTIESHAKLIESRHSLHEACVQIILRRLIDLGLLVCGKDIEKGGPSDTVEEDQITALVIPTKRSRYIGMDRLRLLEKQIEKQPGQIDVVIGTDDDDPEYLANRLKSNWRAVRGRLAVAGPTMRSELIKHISYETGIPVRVVAFGLGQTESGGECFGANRNMLHLLTRGRLVVSIESDVDFSPFKRRDLQTTQALRFTATREIESVAMYDSLAHIEREIVPDDQYLFAEHERILGKTLHGLLLGRGDNYRESGRNDLCSHMVSSLYHRTGKVVLTQSTLAETPTTDGDPDDGQPLEDLRWADFINASESRSGAPSFAIRGSDGLVVRHTNVFNGTAYGLDNRWCLPPFPPTFSNEEAVFGQLVYGNGEFFIGVVPSVLRYCGPRSSALKYNLRGLRTNDVICLIIAGMQARTNISAADALSATGASLIEISGMRQDAFQDHVRSLLYRQLFSRLREFEQACDEQAIETATQSRNARNIQMLLIMIKQCGRGFPVELENCEGGGFEKLQAYLKRFGELLTAWPLINQCANDCGETFLDRACV